MSYPQIIDYHDAVQDPRNAFFDPELKAGHAAVTPLGLPLALSGGFALTYAVKSGSKKFAVRCFHRAVPEAQSRYAAISAKLRTLASSYFVNFDFQSQGIRVHGKPYPIVKMDWVEGETLGSYLDRVASNQSTISNLRQRFVDLASFLDQNGVAHGDIQNENLIVTNGQLRLIDYDGMFVEGLRVGSGSEVGHKHFQHPERATRHFGPAMDRFSSIVVDVSLEALHADASLHRRFREGGQAIIFKANDFADPTSSEVFRTLSGMPAVRQSATKLAAVCGASISNVPTLSDFIAGRNIPIAVAPQINTQSPSPPPAYIGAFDVLDAKDFDEVMRRIGDKIELVGKIVSVKEGTGKRGRGRGKPYVFINFGDWNRESVKLTIWSEGLGNMATRPSEAWVGRWISATGLVEPPYAGNHYGKAYRNVGITVTSDSQIIQLSATEAGFRLKRGGSALPAGSNNAKRSNEQILKEVTSSKGSSARARNPRSRATTTLSTAPVQPQPKTAPLTKNESILKGLQATQGSGVGTFTYAPTNSAPVRRTSNKIPTWVWIVGVLIAINLLRVMMRH